MSGLGFWQNNYVKIDLVGAMPCLIKHSPKWSNNLLKLAKAFEQKEKARYSVLTLKIIVKCLKWKFKNGNCQTAWTAGGTTRFTCNLDIFHKLPSAFGILLPWCFCEHCCLLYLRQNNHKKGAETCMKKMNKIHELQEKKNRMEE